MGITFHGHYYRPSKKEQWIWLTTWMDRLSWKVHFIKSRVTETAVNVTDTFFQNIFMHHGLPERIISDRDNKFRFEFCKLLMEKCGAQLKMSLSRHSQAIGASNIMKTMVKNYITSYCSYHQSNWGELLPAAELAYNSSVWDDLGCFLLNGLEVCSKNCFWLHK